MLIIRLGTINLFLEFFSCDVFSSPRIGRISRVVLAICNKNTGWLLTASSDDAVVLSCSWVYLDSEQ